MIDHLIEFDQELFLLFNGLHTSWMDPIMVLSSKTVVWIPLFAFLLYHIVKTYRERSWLVLLSITLLIILTDQITTSMMKPFFERLRPSHEPALLSSVHIVNGYSGGMYGFASSHAANTFGTSAFLYFLFRNEKKWIAWLFLWAAFVGYTRIYLGLHYPGDIIGGAIVGIICAWLVFAIYNKSKAMFEKRKTPSIDGRSSVDN